MSENFGWTIEKMAPLWASRSLPELAPGWATLQTELAGVCGTDLQMLRGYANFDGFLGHEFVARVIECDRPEWIGRRVVGEINVGCGSCADCQAGDPRFCPGRTVLGIRGLDGCFAERFRLPLTNLYQVDDLDPHQAVFAEPLAAALEAGIHLLPGREVLVLGDGRLGSLIALALREKHPVTVLGRHREKLERLKALGLSICQQTSGLWPIVVEATGSAGGRQQALRVCRPQGTVVLKSTVAESAELDINLVVVNAINLLGSRCGRFEPALQALRSGTVDPRPLIDQILDLNEFPQALQSRGFKTLLRGPAGSGGPAASR